MKPYERLSDFYHDRWGRRIVSCYVPLIEHTLGKHERQPSSVIDISCGTGNLLGVLSEKGYRCEGTDLSSHMISIAAGRYPNIAFSRQNMMNVESTRKFDLILCTFNSVNYLMTEKEVRQMLRSVKGIMSEHALFLIDFATDNLYRGDFVGKTTHSHDGISFEQVGEYDYRARVAKTTFTFPDDEKETHFQRGYRQQEAVKMIMDEGYAILEAYGDFDRSPQDGKSLRLVYVLT